MCLYSELYNTFENLREVGYMPDKICFPSKRRDKKIVVLFLQFEY